MQDTESNFNPQPTPEPKSTWKAYTLAVLGFIVGVLSLVLLLDTVIMPYVVSADNIVSVPKVTGLPTDEAVRSIQGRGLYVHTVHEQYNEKVPRGRVINQLPYPGAEVKTGRRVYLTVSKGRETITMPMLIGRSLRDARISLLQKGIQTGRLSYENSETIPSNSIVAQSVPPGNSVPYGATIDLVISRGSAMDVIVPDLTSLSLKEAEEMLGLSNMQIGSITYQEDETFEDGTVISQFPAAGELVTNQNGQLAINLVISRRK